MIYALAACFGALLLFFVQPLLGKAMAPRFGGGVHVWMVCLLYFQAMLLVGYGYAHLLVRHVKPRLQPLVHSGLLTLTALQLLLPWALGGSLPLLASAGTDLRPLAILGFLLKGSGLALLALGSTAPLIQAWFARANPGRSPYRLYAASNIGSMAGLFLFPFAAEPLFRTSTLLKGFGFAFLGFAVVLILIGRKGAAADASGTAENQEPSAPAAPVGWGRIALWLLASCSGVMLLMTGTQAVTLELAALPLLWVIPLALYLATFILVFDSRWPLERWLRPGWALLLAAACLVLGRSFAERFAPWPMIAAFNGMVFFGCLGIHGYLHALRPDPAHLTRYYFYMALGGMIGGLVVGLVAPVLYPRPYEMGVALALAGFLGFLWIRSHKSRFQALWALLALATLVVGVRDILQIAVRPGLHIRDYFGVFRIRDIPPLRCLFHGSIIHGAIDLKNPLRPTTYYGPDSGGGRAVRMLMEARPSLKVGVVGMGVGSFGGWGRASDHYTYYEISPQVVRIAGPGPAPVFPILQQSPARVEVVLGDARTELERELREQGPRGFDLLVVDAFSGDAVPWHLITVESVQMYLRHLAPNGILALHVSNRLPVHRVALQTCTALNLSGALVRDVRGRDENIYATSYYVLVAKDPDAFFQHPLVTSCSGIAFGPELLPDPKQPLPLLRSGRPWRDDHAPLSDLLIEKR